MMAPTYKLVEIFESIQGEGTMQGTLVTFVRLAGCNRKCIWCDTKHEAKVETNVEGVLSGIRQNIPWVVITGGEPTLHDLKPLARVLRHNGHKVALETNGTGYIPKECFDWITCSPKGPEYKYTPTVLPSELKFVVDDLFNLSDISDFLNSNSVLEGWEGTITLQVESTSKESQRRVLSMLRERPELRLGVQLHKYLGVR